HRLPSRAPGAGGGGGVPRRRRWLPGALRWLGGAGGAGLLAAGLLAATAPAQENASGSVGQSVAPVFSQTLPNVPGHTLTAVVVDYAPGGRSASHRHAGSVFAYVLEGAIRSRLDDGPETVYRAGDSFFEPPGTHH